MYMRSRFAGTSGPPGYAFATAVGGVSASAGMDNTRVIFGSVRRPAIGNVPGSRATWYARPASSGSIGVKRTRPPATSYRPATAIGADVPDAVTTVTRR